MKRISNTAWKAESPFVTQTTARIVITPGEPAGIGPDVCIDLAESRPDCEIVLVADKQLLQQRAQLLGKSLQLETVATDALQEPAIAGRLRVLHVALPNTAQPGQLDHRNAAYVLECISTATQLCLSGAAQALVTGPVHKGIINQAGIAFTGHTGYLAELCHCPRVVMMLATPGLRVALATTHIPLQEVAQQLSAELLEQAIRIIDHDLRTRFGLAQPRIRVCGLNPHAGEDGHLGTQERDMISPLLRRLQQQGLDLQGPVPADTAFLPESLSDTDVILAMYHDQGLPVLKYAGFRQAVNVTLGLPINRTSVDHGTALSLAGSGMADSTSLRYALTVALQLARQTLAATATAPTLAQNET